jgi:membrane protein required for colicin V production
MQYIEAYNLIDLFIVATMSITVILGIWKGFVKSLTGLASLVLGVVLAMKYHATVAPYLSKICALDPQISLILSMVTVFVLVQVLFVVVRRVLDKLLDVTRLTWLDRALGAAMGAAAGFLIVASTVQAILMGIPDWPLVKMSKLIVPVDRLTEKAMTHAPQRAKDQWVSFVKKWKGTQDQVPYLPNHQSASSTTAPATPSGPAK